MCGKVAEMSAGDALALIRLIGQNRMEIHVDGGWAVDALLGVQTRPHDDLDIAMPHKYVPGLRRLLAGRGYREIPRDDTRDCNFVLGDDGGHIVDVHTYTFDAVGRNIQGLAYLPEHLEGHGVINGQPVRCITPEWLVKFHTGYDLDEKDFRDVLALCRKFDIPLPGEYQKFMK